MKTVAVFFTLFSATVATYAAQAPMSTSTGDPYDGVLKGRIYSNPFFGFSLELPKDWSSNLGSLESSKFLSPEKIERLRSEFRERGIVLSAHRKIRVNLPGPNFGPLTSRDPPYGVETRRPDIRQAQPKPIPQRHSIVITGPSESLYIIAYPIAESSVTSARELVARDTEKLKSEAPDLEASEISEITLDGRRFLRTDYIVRSRDPGSNATFSSRYVTVLRDHVLALTVVAHEAKKRGQLVKMIEAIKFTPE